MAVRTVTLPLKNEVASLNNIQVIGGDVIYDPLRFDPLDKIHLIWMKNVMPAVKGLTAMIQRPLVTTPISTTYTASYPYRVEPIYDETGEPGYYFRTPGPDIFIKKDWTVQNAGTSGGSDIYTFNTYRATSGHIFFNRSRLAVRYNISTNTWTSLSTQGITQSALYGICTALNYMIAWDKDNIFWSAPDLPGEFREEVLGVRTGAGSSSMSALTGEIIACYQIANGFMIYGTDNIIAATYSQNSDFPWIFTEVEGSAGVDLHDRIAYSGALGTHYAWTKRGIQEVNNSEANQIFPEVTSFLSGSVFFESSDNGSYAKTESYYNNGTYNVPLPLHTKVALVGGRYFCISYGVYEGVFKYVLVYDIFLKQWGKIKIDHLDVFEVLDNAANPYVPGTSKLLQVPCNFGILKSDGTVDMFRSFYEDQVASQNPGNSVAGEFTIGDIKFTNESQCSISKIKIQGIIASANFSVYVKTKYEDGTESAEVQFTPSTTEALTFLGDVRGRSHRIRIKGAFTIEKILVDIAQTGRL